MRNVRPSTTPETRSGQPATSRTRIDGPVRVSTAGRTSRSATSGTRTRSTPRRIWSSRRRTPCSTPCPRTQRRSSPPGRSPEIGELLALVKQANNEMHGTRSSVGHVLLGGDELVGDVRRRLRAWADAYVSTRLAKPSSRDGSEVARYKRLVESSCPTSSASRSRRPRSTRRSSPT